MKKITITLIILVMLLNVCGNIFAVQTITEDDLEKAIIDYKQLILDSNDEKNNMEIDKENDIIIITNEGRTFNIKYDLSNEPKFSVEEKFEKGMTYDEYKEKFSIFSGLILGYSIIANIKGVDIPDSILYLSIIYTGELIKNDEKKQGYIIVEENENSVNIIKDNAVIIPESEFGEHVIEYVSEKYKDININDKDGYDTFEIKITSDKIDENNCTVKATINVNVNGNFEEMKGITENMFGNKEDNNIGNISGGIIGSGSISISGNMILDSNVVSKAEEIVKNNNIANYIGNSKKLPQTGKSFEIVDILYITIFASVGILVLLIIKNKRYKNINK